MRRLGSFTKKYGFIVGPYSVLKWRYKKRKFKIYAANIVKTESKFFHVVGTTMFREFYEGDFLADSVRVRNGERKILFYNQKDINMQKDIKTRWELNRMQHLPLQALSSLEMDEFEGIKKAFHFNNLKKVFEETNAMEVAISTVNVITAYQLIKDNKKDILIEKFLKESLVYIMTNLENGLKFSNNHYFFNLIGILWILENISTNDEMKNLKQEIYKEMQQLLKELLNQDGSLYECSTYYHKYVTESLLAFLVFNKQARKHSQILTYAKSMYDFSCYASYNDELIGIGDNDSGRILSFPEYFNYSSRNLMTTHKLAKELDFYCFNAKEELRIKQKNTSKTTSFGLLKMENQYWKVAIRCEQIRNKSKNKIIGSHSHNDQLSVQVNYQNKNLFVDNGVYSYIQENNFRLKNLETASHNTVVINNQEQNDINNEWNYTEKKAAGKIISMDKFVFEGEHTGYTNKVHQRRVEIKNEVLLIKDTIRFYRPENNVIVEIFYHLHPDTEVLIMNEREILLKLSEEVNLTMKIKNKVKLRIKESYYCPEYGMRRDSKVIVLTFESKKIQNLITFDIEIY